MSRRDDDELAPIALRDARLKRNPSALPWSWRLHLFVRGIAVIEFAKGLYHWGALIGIGAGEAPFAGASTAWSIATVVFAVADLVAAVGLWLGAAWGVVIWLIAASSQMLFGVLNPQAFAGSWWIAAFQGTAMAVYLALSIKAKREKR